MGMLDLFFKKNDSLEVTRIKELYDYIYCLLDRNEYIARSEYSDDIKSYEDIVQYYCVLKESDSLKRYCKKNHLSFKDIIELLDLYDRIDDIVEDHNNRFIVNQKEQLKDYLDTILYDVDPIISLDDDQRSVVLCDEDYTLVIAGAGAGKTTTMAAKVKYLVEKKNVAPEDILVLSFTNKAVKELRDKLNNDLKIMCPVTTFHSIGYMIIRNETEEKLNIVMNNKLYYVLQDYFKDKVLKNERMVKELIMFFASYFDAPYTGDDLNHFFNTIAKNDYKTMRSELNDFRKEVIDRKTKNKITIQNEYVRSIEEVIIANYLYINNIDYEYEPIYPYHIENTTKPYTPDFIIRQGNNEAYIEHFGISQDGKNNLYDSYQLEKYKKAVKDKIKLHKEHGTNLIFTFSSFTDNRTIIEHLEKELIRCGFVLKKKSKKEILDQLISNEENKYIKRLIMLICRFISNFKTNGYNQDEFDRMYYSSDNVRTRLFLNICKECYLEYIQYLKENNAIDFNDMINDSARILKEMKDNKQELKYKYIIIDEYQDISRQRFNLISALKDVCKAKIIAVGDDWQSIYAFSGSDISLFTKFSELVGYAKLLKIVKTYRNSQEVIDIAGKFIQKNKNQITKKLISHKHINDPVIIYTYDGTYKKDNHNTNVHFEMAKALEQSLSHIIANSDNKNKKILLLGRFGFDGKNIEKSGLFEYSNYGNKLRSLKYPSLDITYMTAHSSKGLGYDEVIIINGKNDTYGFPSKIEDDPVLSFVTKTDKAIEYAEERRLFYVAMTRTKNRVYFIAPMQNPSEFLLEIKQDYKNIVLNGKWNEAQVEKVKNICPVCGYPLQYRYKSSYGLKLYICTNEPELCSYMTNVKESHLSIMKCNQCIDGYMIVKGKNGNYFLGCTNYKANGKGCNHTISNNRYNETSNYNIASRVEEKIMYNGYELKEVIEIIIKTLKNINGHYRFGKHMLKDVLKESKNQKIIKYNLHEIEGYGALKDIQSEDIITIIDYLIEQSVIVQTESRYPLVYVSDEIDSQYLYSSHHLLTLLKRLSTQS